MAAGAGLDGDAERLAGFGQPLAPIAEIAQGGPLEAAAGKLMQHRNDALAIMLVGRRDVDCQRETILIDREMDFDALDFLAAIEAAREASRRRMTGAAVNDDGAGFGSIAASLSPSLDQAVEQPAPQAKPGPASKQRVQRAERNVAQLADRAPLQAAKADAPDRHDRLAQRRSGQWRLRPAPCWLRARHGREFRQHRVDEGVNVTESIPRGQRSLGGVEGGAHRLLVQWLLRWPQTEPIALPRVSPHSPQSSMPVSTGRHAPSVAVGA